MEVVELYPEEGSGSCPVLEGEAWSVIAPRTELVRPSGKKGLPKVVGYTGQGCTMCSRHKKRSGDDITKPFSEKGDPAYGSILMVFSFLNFTDSSHLAVQMLRESGFKGRIVCDLPVRCGTGDVTETQINNCRPYLKTVIYKMRPTRIFCFGGNASKAVLGVAMPSAFNRWCWTTIATEWGEVPVIGLMDPVKAARSPIHRAIMKNELKWGWETDFKPFPRQGRALVPDPSDIKGSIEAIYDWVDRAVAAHPRNSGEMPWVAYDVETDGVMFTDGFSIIACSVASYYLDDVLVWDKAALEVPEFLEVLVEILTDLALGKRGSNEKYDSLSWLSWKNVVVQPVTGDCRLEMKLNNSDSSATLEAMGFYVGSNAHKSEAKALLKEAKKLGAEDMDDDVEGVNVLAHSYKYLPRSTLIRYNGLDTRITAHVCQYARKRMGVLTKTLNRLTLPAAEVLKRIEGVGMLIDRNAIEVSRAFLDGEIKGLSKVFAENGIDPDKPESIRNWLDSIGLQSPYETSTGLASTSARALKLIESQNELIAKILEHRKLSKLLHSYAETLPGYIRRDGRVHPTFLMDGARSGRLSCIAGHARMLTNFGMVRLDQLGEFLARGPVYTVTHRGRWQRVLACWSNGLRPTVIVRTRDGKELQATADHLLHTHGAWVQAGTTRGREIQVSQCPGVVALKGKDSPATRMGVNVGLGVVDRLGGVSKSVGAGASVAVDVLHSQDAMARRAGPPRPSEGGVLQLDSEVGGEVRGVHRRAASVRRVCKEHRKQAWRGAPHCTAGRNREETTREWAYTVAAPHDDGLQRERDQEQPQGVGAVARRRGPLHEDQVAVSRRLPCTGEAVARVHRDRAESKGGPDPLLRKGLRGWARAGLPVGQVQEDRTCSSRTVPGFVPRLRHVQDVRRRKLHREGVAAERGAARPTGEGPSRGQVPGRGFHRLEGGFGDRRLHPHDAPGIRQASDGALPGRGLRRDAREEHGGDCGPSWSGGQATELCFSTVVDVQPAGTVEVFDFTVEEDHSALIEGVIAHNCRNPAVQTIPSRGKLAKLIKSCFVSRPGYTLVALDFSILEIRIAAYLSQDPDMLRAAQTDYHTETAKRIARIAWGISPEEVEAEILRGVKDKRDICKTINFSVLYGAGPPSIAEKVGCSPKEVMKLINAIVPPSSRLRAWMREQEAFACRHGYVEIPWLDGTVGRVRPLLDVTSNDREARGNALRAAVNTPVQSLASDICLSSAVRIDDWYQRECIPANIVCLVHDSIISEVRDDFVDRVAVMKAHLMCDWPTSGVPLKVEAEKGKAWGAMEKVAV